MDPTTVGFSSQDLRAQTSSYPCILPHLPGRGKINGPYTPMDLEDLWFDFFSTHEDTKKPSGKAFNALFSPTNLRSGVTVDFPKESRPSINTYQG
jgi:hypothetical protein